MTFLMVVCAQRAPLYYTQQRISNVRSEVGRVLKSHAEAGMHNKCKRCDESILSLNWIFDWTNDETLKNARKNVKTKTGKEMNFGLPFFVYSKFIYNLLFQLHIVISVVW